MNVQTQKNELFSILIVWSHVWVYQVLVSALSVQIVSMVKLGLSCVRSFHPYLPLPDEADFSRCTVLENGLECTSHCRDFVLIGLRFFNVM